MAHESGQRAKPHSAEELRGRTHSANLRDGERETAATTPPAVGPAVARAEPLPVATTVRGKQDRIAIRVVDGLVHDNNPHQAHCLNLRVRELLTDKAGDLGIRIGKFPALHEGAGVGVRADGAGDASVVVPQHSLQNSDVRHDAIRRFEVRRKKDVLRPLRQPEALLFETGDPLLSGRAVRGDTEIDHHVLLAVNYETP